MGHTRKTRQTAYDRVFTHITDALKSGTVPWRKPWKSPKVSLAQLLRCNTGPANYLSKKPYRGINVLLTAMQGYTSRYWVSFKQAKKLGGHVRKGEESTTIIFWRFVTTTTDELDEDGEPIEKRFPILRYYNVFNTEQCKFPDEKQAEIDEANATAPLTKPDEKSDEEPDEEFEKFEEIEAGQGVVDGYFDSDTAPNRRINRLRACYSPSADCVSTPAPEQFDPASEYYATMYHEIAHSTGHESRLDRGLTGDRASDSYGIEELVAELAAATLCYLTGMSPVTLDNAAGYIQHWLKAIEEDRKMLVYAGARAQKAVDYIIEEVKSASERS